MDFKRALKEAANLTAEIGKASMPVAKGIAKAGVAVSKAGYEKAGETVQRVQENRELEQENKKIVVAAERKWQDSISRLEAAMEDAKEALLSLEKRREHILEFQGARFQRLCEYEACFSDAQAGERFIFDSKVGDIKDLRENFVTNESQSNPTIRGAASGIAAAATAVSATAVWGTASTGTAIAGLKGAAAMNATLASLGGGSLATGGLGMAGGMAVLGGLVIIPGIAVGGFIWDKNVRNAHAKAMEYVRNAEKASTKAMETRRKYQYFSHVIRDVIYETTTLNGFLDGLLDLFEFEIINGADEASKNLCIRAVEVTNKLLCLKVTTENGEPNKFVHEELRVIHSDMDYVKHNLGSYLAGLNEQRRQEAKQQVEEALKQFQKSVEKKPIIKPLRNEELREVFIRTFDWAKKEICILAPWINRRVVDSVFLDKMERALGRGVSIRMVYGIGEVSSNKQSPKADVDRNKRTEELAIELRKRFARYGKRFTMRRSNTHGKLLICDDVFYVIGSFNFLSFDGDYTNKDVREELGDYSENKEMIDVYRRRHFAF